MSLLNTDTVEELNKDYVDFRKSNPRLAANIRASTSTEPIVCRKCSLEIEYGIITNSTILYDYTPYLYDIKVKRIHTLRCRDQIYRGWGSERLHQQKEGNRK